MTLFQATTDTGIHLTLGSGIAAIFVKILWDEVRSRRNGNGKCRYDAEVLKDIRDGINKLVTIVETKNKL